MRKINILTLLVAALTGAALHPAPAGTAITAATSTAAATTAATTAAAAVTGWVPVVPAPVDAGTAAATEVGARCTDATGNWLDIRWSGELRWRFNPSTVPAYLGDPEAVATAIGSAATTVSRGRNDCGMPETLNIRQRYDGETTRRAGVTSDGGCANRDGHNTVSFGHLNAGLLAVTCVWWYGGENGGRSVETDILIDDAGGLFFLSPPAGCAARWDLESTLTHEFGHAYGLGHVSFAQHGDLTMSDSLPDCSTAHRTLGLGDYLALQRQYGAA